MEDLIADYEHGTLGPVEVKQALVKAINKILQVSISLFTIIFYPASILPLPTLWWRLLM